MNTAQGGFTFVVRVYGAEAVEDVRQIRDRLVKEVASAELMMAAATTTANNAITSQTRRLAANSARLGETRTQLESLAGHWEAMAKEMAQAGASVFMPLVQSAIKAYNQLIGHSILVDLQNQVLAIYKHIEQASLGIFNNLPVGAKAAADAATTQSEKVKAAMQVLYKDLDVLFEKMEAASKDTFDPLAKDAKEAAKQVNAAFAGVMDAAGRMRFPAGTMLEGVNIGGKFATPESIEAYRQGLLKLQDVMPGKPLPAANLLPDKPQEVIGWWDKFTEQLNLATLKYFGLRRVGYGLEQFGNQLAMAGQKNVTAMAGWAKTYASFNEYATRAAAAMEMTAGQQELLEESVLNNVEAMRLFSPEETIDGLRAWAAGTGLVVRSQGDLDAALEQTRSIQILAALGNQELAQTMATVGGGLAEFGLQLDDVDRVTALYNFTAAKTFANVNDVGQAFRLVGPLAASMGVSIEEAAAAIGLLSDENIKGTMAGRAFRQMLIQLARPTDAHNKAMNRALGMSGELGDSWRELVFPNGKFIGLAKYVDLLAAATERMTEAQRTELLATIATANELPALVALVGMQTEARKDGINILRAWTKWSVGAMDEEVQKFQEFMERTRGVEYDVSTDMYDLWNQQSGLFYDSEAARMKQYEQQWRSIQMKLGEIVLDEARGTVEGLLELLSKLAVFAQQHPQLVKGAIIAAGAELVLGNLIRLSGQLVGVVANFLILRGAFTGFGLGVGTFQTAVAAFAQAVGVDAAARGGGGGAAAAGGGAATAVAAKLGLLGILSRLLGVAGIIWTVEQGGNEIVQTQEEMLTQFRALGVTVEQWNALMAAGVRWAEGEEDPMRARPHLRTHLLLD